MATTTVSRREFSWKTLLDSQDAALAVALVGIIILMIIPLPAFVLDLLIALNLAISIGVIMITMYIRQPMEFSSFPTMLLLITLLRLGINISTSRRILLDGNAGKVIDTFGSLVVGGNYVIGVVVFLMLMIIQWVVINNGAGRVAEVAARFTLDALPGKQMSIDADLNAGLIDENDARIRRREVQEEADFYGSMDGASKFVKGDAIAAIVIILVNILGGFLIGMLQQGLTAMDALQRYTLVTVGAGLAVQIPALLVSSAAGFLVTRSTSDGSMGSNLSGQLSNLNGMIAVSVIISSLALVPGLPKMPFLLIGAGLGAASYYLWQEKQKVQVEEEEPPPLSTEPETPQDMLEMIVVDPMEVEVGYGLIPLVDNQTDNLLDRITQLRRQVMNELGLVLPVVRVHDNLNIPPQAYRIKIRGEEVAQGELLVGRLLAIPGAQADLDDESQAEKIRGIPTTEPTFGLPATWIAEAQKSQAELIGYTVVSPLSVLSTHLSEVVRSQAPDLLGRQMVQEMLDQLKLRAPAAVDGVVPELLGLSEIQEVLRNLLGERVPIRDLGGILEVLATNAVATRDPDILSEAVRQTMARTISNRYRDPNGFLHVFTLSPTLEAFLRNNLSAGNSGFVFQIDASLAQAIISSTGQAMEELAIKGYQPILICSREIRLAFFRLIRRSLSNLVILAYPEVSRSTKVKSYSVVDVPHLPME